MEYFLFHVLMIFCDDFKIFLSVFTIKFVEYMAAGLFPSIFVAFCTDVANTKRQKNAYEKFHNSSLNVLKSMCENLPTELHACIASIYLKENASEEKWNEVKTFSEWCRILYDKKDKTQIQYIQQEVRAIKSEAIKALEKLTSYETYYNEKNNDAIKKLIDGCNAFCRVVSEDGKYTGQYVCYPDSLIQAVIALFPINLEENKYIKIGYSGPFNSDNFCE